MNTNNVVISIGRQFGSGGREITKKLASELNIPYYDSALLELAVEKSGLCENVLKDCEEKSGSFLYSLTVATSTIGGRITPTYDMPINDKLFLLQSDIIKEKASESNCIFLGRCADYVLRENEKVINVFIQSSLDKRIERKIPLNPNLTREKVKSHVIKTDKKRASYYNFYTANKWGKMETYDMVLDSGKLGIDNCVKILKQIYLNVLSDKD